MLHTWMFEVQSIHLHSALWMGMSLSQIKKIPSFWEWPSPSPRNNWGPRCTFLPFFIVFVKDSILGNWLQKRALEARGKSSAKRERRRRESLLEAQEIPRSGETISQFLALNSCKAHTSSISCSYLVCDTDYLLLCVGKFFFFTRPGQVFFFLPMWVKFFFPSMCGSSFFFFFFYLWVGQVFFFFTKTSCSPPLKSNGASLILRIPCDIRLYPKMCLCTPSSKRPAWVMQYFKHCAMHNTFQQSKIRFFMCGNYIVQAEKHTALPNQKYLWFASMGYLNFFTNNYRQNHRLQITIKYNSLVWLTFDKIIDFSMHNVYWAVF